MANDKKPCQAIGCYSLIMRSFQMFFVISDGLLLFPVLNGALPSPPGLLNSLVSTIALLGHKVASQHCPSTTTPHGTVYTHCPTPFTT